MGVSDDNNEDLSIKVESNRMQFSLGSSRIKIMIMNWETLRDVDQSVLVMAFSSY